MRARIVLQCLTIRALILFYRLVLSWFVPLQRYFPQCHFCNLSSPFLVSGFNEMSAFLTLLPYYVLQQLLWYQYVRQRIDLGSIFISPYLSLIFYLFTPLIYMSSVYGDHWSPSHIYTYIYIYILCNFTICLLAFSLPNPGSRIRVLKHSPLPNTPYLDVWNTKASL